MFYYYGRRKQIAHLYPAPGYNRIIEPFAGSAAYSLYWAEQGLDLSVMLIDKNQTVAQVWNYLLSATAMDLKNLPSFDVGDNIDSHQSLTQAEKELIGFHINPGSSVPKKTVSKASRWEAGRRYIIRMLPFIKNWQFIHGDYQQAENETATWFIDPPFQFGGSHYPHQISDYSTLAAWSIARKGQVIVCEAEPATWLPFDYLGSVVNNGGLNKAKKRPDLIWAKSEKPTASLF